jgi:acyl CoA:acetate/3-ketoacid CoA transferase
VIFCGTLTAKGLRVGFDQGELVIEQEGAVTKFVSEVEQITWSASEAVRRHQRVLYITERAVFRLIEDGLELVEVAPGLGPEDVLSAMEFAPRLADPLAEIPAVVYSEEALGLAELFHEEAKA